MSFHVWSVIMILHSRPQRPRSFWPAPSPRFKDFPSLCACSESSLTNLIGSGLNLLCLQSHSKTECRWTGPEVAILGADQRERGLWGREWCGFHSEVEPKPYRLVHTRLTRSASTSWICFQFLLVQASMDFPFVFFVIGLIYFLILLLTTLDWKPL